MGLTRLLKATTRRTAKAALYLAGLVAAVLATIVVVFAVQARARLPDLQPWHRIELAEEFRAGRAGAPQTSQVSSESSAIDWKASKVWSLSQRYS